ncbi:MAG: cbb3-type cytochrome c oxidase subunit I [Anaerolineae bacterium]|nr:cbb3-type cytochrome c oxidase subunit I [Anaerolineae bacterium]
MQAQATQTASGNVPVVRFPALSMLSSERALIGAHILVSIAAVSLGGLLGPFQTFRRAPAMQWEIPVFSYYYQALTLHGVLNALVFTTFFIMGISYFVTQRSLERPLKSQRAGWVSFGMMFTGLLLAAYAILSNQANVMFTFYPPMLAHWTFYLGLALVVTGTWVGVFNVFWTYAAWRRDHPGERVPLAVFAVLTNFVMWFTASLGVAIEVVFMLLPMSLGIINTTDVQVARILFWFMGHPIVYFWLIPAYLSWYTMLPKQLGVKLFSDSMARVAFLMLMIFSIPIGVHHLFSDPGVSEGAKLLHALLTFVVAVPSLLTAFNLAATLERAGRKRGAKHILGWLWKQPWGNPLVVAQLGGMLLFIVGGITGISNASWNLNVALHNTTWIVGHFHMTLAGAVFLTYMGILYWLMPLLRGRALWRPRLALAQVYTWFFGMILFGLAMGRAGLEGAIRRTDAGAPDAYVSEAVAPWLNLTALGGVVLFVSLLLLFAVIIGTLFFSKQEVEERAPVDTEGPPAATTPRLFERWALWVVVIVISNLIMWGPVLLEAFDPVNGFWAIANPGAAR